VAAVRRGSAAVMRFYVPVLVLAVIVQIFLAGEGIFGIKAGPELDDQNTLDPHRAFGFILAEPAALILLISRCSRGSRIGECGGSRSRSHSSCSFSSCLPKPVAGEGRFNP
jgi:hypothetical protein